MDTSTDRRFLYTKTLHPPTGVSHCVKSQFTSPSAVNLVLAKGNVLEIYEYTSNPEAPLVLLKHYELHGTIEALAPVRFAQHSTDCLILGFHEAKASVVCYDEATDDLHTVSVYYMEEDFLQEEKSRNIKPNLQIKVEPHGRCAAVVVYNRWLFLIPFTQEDDILFQDKLFGETLVDKPTKPAIASVKEKLPVGPYVVVDFHSLGLTSVRDICFLHGFAEPSVAVLHEQDASWAGRLHLKNLSCALTCMALSGLNSEGGPLAYPVILHLNHLPHDSFGLVSLDEPVNGVLVLATNSIAHVTQTKTISCYVNDYGKAELAGATYPSQPPNMVENTAYPGASPWLNLQNARRLVLSPTQVLLAMGNADLYLVTLQIRGGVLQSFQFTIGHSSVVASCLCKFSETELFLGSRISESWLVDVVISSDTAVPDLTSNANATNEKDAASKGFDLDSLYDDPTPLPKDDTKKSGENDLQTLFDLFHNKADAAPKGTSSAMTRFSVQKVDCIANIGPIVEATVGESGRQFEDEVNPRVALAKRMARSYHEKLQAMDMLTCSGYGEAGSINILQRGIRTQVLKALQLDGVKGLWSINIPTQSKSRKRARDEKDTNAGEGYDTHLMITRAIGGKQGTMVWQSMGGKLEEVDVTSVGFEMRGLTLNLSTILDGRMAVQVLQRYFVVLKGTERMCNVFLIDAEQDPPQLHAHSSAIHSPYIFVHTLQGSLHMYTFHSMAEQEKRIKDAMEKGENKPPMSCFVDTGRKPAFTQGLGRLTAFTIFDTNGPGDAIFQGSATESQLFCMVWWSCGALEVYSVPSFERLFICLGAMGMPQVMMHEDPGQLPRDPRWEYNAVYATEIAVRKVGAQHEVPYVFLTFNTGEVVVYKPFHYSAEVGKDLSWTDIRFNKVMQEVYSEGLMMPMGGEDEEEVEWVARMELAGLRPKSRDLFVTTPHHRILVPFDDISNYRGVFLNGASPSWMFTLKGHLIKHPMVSKGPVQCLTPFHIPNCHKGYVAFAEREGALHISLLQCPTKDARVSLTTWWPSEKIRLRATPHYIMFHPVHRTYTVVTSVTAPYKPRQSELVDPNDALAQQQIADQLAEYEAKCVPKATQDRYSVQLFTADTWWQLDSIQLEENEIVISAKTIQISKEDASKQYGRDDDELNRRLRKGADTTDVQCIGSAYVVDEDLPCRGRVLLLDVFPNISSGKNDRKLLVLYQSETKGPVTAVTAVHGYIVLAVSSKIMVYFYDWRTRKLVIASFFDAQFYITSMNSIKSFVLYGDGFKSLSFLKWREDTRQLVFLGKDFERAEVMTANFMYEGSSLCFPLTDRNQNLSVLTYNPESPDSSGGLMLMPVADINLNANVHCMLSLRALKQAAGGNRSQADKTVIIYCTLEGSIGALFPIAEDQYRRLYHLASKMHTEVSHDCGLHPKAHRIYRGHRKQRMVHTTYHTPNIVDGDLVTRFGCLDSAAQHALAKRLGSRVDVVVNILRGIHDEIPF